MGRPADGDPAFRSAQRVRQPPAPPREHQRERPRPESPRQRARRFVERETLRFRHVPVGHQQQEWRAGPPALETGHRLHLWAPCPRAQAIYRLRRIGDQPARAEMGNHPRERGRHVLVGPEGDDGHRSSRASASATRKSSAVVTLRLYGESGTTSTGKPARSHSSASSVGAVSPFATSAYARSIIARGNPCGVCARHKRSLATVLVIRSCSTSLTVSETGIAATAPTPDRTLAITPSIVSRVTNGRAASWTRTTAACGGSAPRPARTDWARVAPPATSASRSPTSLPSHSGGRTSNPVGTTTITCPTSGWEVNGRSARNSIGTPRIGRNCFASPGPARTPAPAATTTTPASGRESPGELTDAVHADQIEPGQAHPRAGGQEYAAESLARRFAQASLDGRHGADLAAQADLAQEHGVRRERSVVHARDQGRHDGEIGRGLEQPHPARHVHEHVPLTERQATAALEDREQDRQAAVVESRGHPLRGAEAALRRQRLDLDQQRTRPFHQRGHRGAGNTGGASRQKRRGWVRHGLEIQALAAKSGF